MVSLPSLLTKLLIEILISCPTTRTLVRLSSVNRRMRSIWLEHSEHIIVANYKPKTPHVEQAIALTLTEVQCGEIPKSPEDHRSLTAPRSMQDQPSIRFYLPRMLHNAALASVVCDDLAHRAQTGRFSKRVWQEPADPFPDSIRSYYMTRHIAFRMFHSQQQHRPEQIRSLTYYDWRKFIDNDTTIWTIPPLPMTESRHFPCTTLEYQVGSS